ncbi:MAG TPA: hypothetical protein VEQ11_08410 [Chloroflexota bacterium]|nr:hypothetical protein [Chloroflexota bacterium]
MVSPPSPEAQQKLGLRCDPAGPVGHILQDATGSWLPIFGVAVVFDIAAATLAITVLRRMHLSDVARAALPREAGLAAVPAA